VYKLLSQNKFQVIVDLLKWHQQSFIWKLGNVRKPTLISTWPPIYAKIFVVCTIIKTKLFFNVIYVNLPVQNAPMLHIAWNVIMMTIEKLKFWEEKDTVDVKMGIIKTLKIKVTKYALNALLTAILALPIQHVKFVTKNKDTP